MHPLYLWDDVYGRVCVYVFVCVDILIGGTHTRESLKEHTQAHIHYAH